jgi:hypothetical protein
MGRAAQAGDQASAKALFEEVANHWIALAEELEWLEQSNRRRAMEPAIRARGSATIPQGAEP